MYLFEIDKKGKEAYLGFLSTSLYWVFINSSEFIFSIWNFSSII
jgi:hypothetical protein